MWYSCIEGVALGLGLAIMFGPAFFSLVQTSLKNGFSTVARLAIGIFLSDTFLVVMAIFGASKLFEFPITKLIVSVVGGGILIGMGICTYRSKSDIEATMKIAKQAASTSTWKTMLKGFFINLSNPATWLFWFFWVSIIMGRYTQDGRTEYMGVFVFFASALLTVISTDLLKGYLAHKIKPYMTNKAMNIVNKVVGIILVGIGVYLICSILPIFN